MTTEFIHSHTLPIQARRSCQTNTCYRPHTHDAFSIGLIDSGRSLFTGTHGTTYELSPGDTIIIPAGCVHSCNPLDSTWLYQMTHMDQAWVASLLNHPSHKSLFHEVQVLHDPEIYQGFTHITTLLFEDAATPDSAPQKITELLQKLLGRCAEEDSTALSASPEDPSQDPTTEIWLRPTLSHLANTLASPVAPPIGVLAAAAGMSSPQLTRSMKRRTGFTPIAWRQNARINQAREMIQAGYPLAATAAELGFSDQSHFTRVFKAHVAASPSEYRG